MSNLTINSDEIILKNSFVNFEIQKKPQMKESPYAKKLPDDLIEAINDTRSRKNLNGPFKTAEEAVASMLED